MTINYSSKAIEMTKTEAKTAGKRNSEKFEELQALKAVEPAFPVVVVKSTARKGDHFKGLTYSYMENYIKGHDKDGSTMAVFNELRGLNADGNKMELAPAASYGEIKMWFLSQYPEIEAMTENVNRILDNARKTRAARKVA